MDTEKDAIFCCFMLMLFPSTNWYSWCESDNHNPPKLFSTILEDATDSKTEIRYAECFIWFYKHIHSLVFSIWIRDLKHSFKQKNWNSFFIYNLLWHEDQIAGTVEHFLSINQTASQYLGVQTHSRHWIRLLSTQSSMMTRAGERWDGMQLHIKFFDLTESQK